MERYKNIVKIEKVKELLEKGRAGEALSVAKEIDLSRIKSVSDACAVGECFFVNGKYEDAKQCYKRAYDINPTHRVVIAMINLSLKTKNVEETKRYINEFDNMAPQDYMRFVYRYKLAKMQKKPISELIGILKELNEFEYTDKWAYELVKLYHKANMHEECKAECDSIILWFNYGEYVEKAKALLAYYRGELRPEDLLNRQAETEIQETSEEEYAAAEQNNSHTEESADIADPADESKNDKKTELNEALNYLHEESNALINPPKRKDKEQTEETADEASGDVSENRMQTDADSENTVPEETDENNAEKAEITDETQDYISGEDLVAAVKDKTAEEIRSEEEEEERRFAETLKKIIESEEADRTGNKDASSEATGTGAAEDPNVSGEEGNEDIQVSVDLLSELEGIADKEEKKNEVENVLKENSVFSDLKALINTPDIQYDSRLGKVLRAGNTDIERAIGIYADFESLGSQFLRSMEILLNPKASGLGLVLTGPEKSGKTSLAKGVAKLLAMAGRIEGSGIMVVEAERLNSMDFGTKLPKLKGHAVVINHAGKISRETADSIVKYESELESSTVLILEDERAAITGMFRTNTRLNKVFSNRINLEPVNLDILFRFAARYIMRKDYHPDTSAAIRLEQMIRDYYAKDKTKSLTQTGRLVRQTIKNADARCAKALLDYSSDGRLTEIDMSVIIGGDVSDIPIAEI